MKSHFQNKQWFNQEVTSTVRSEARYRHWPPEQSQRGVIIITDMGGFRIFQGKVAGAFVLQNKWDN